MKEDWIYQWLSDQQMMMDGCMGGWTKWWVCGWLLVWLDQYMCGELCWRISGCVDK